MTIVRRKNYLTMGGKNHESAENEDGTNSVTLFPPSGSDKAKFANLIIEEEEWNERGDSESSYAWASAHGYTVPSESNLTQKSLASYDSEFSQELANIHMAERDPRGYLHDQRRYEGWNRFIPGMEVRTRICNENGHCDPWSKRQETN